MMLFCKSIAQKGRKMAWRVPVIGLFILSAGLEANAVTPASAAAQRFQWEFKRADGFSGWGRRDMNNVKFSDDAVSFVSGVDSSIVSPGLSLDPAVFNLFEIEMRVDKETTGELFFTLQGNEFTQKESISFRVKPSSGFQTYRIDCRRHPLWCGTIARLRFDPTSASGVTVELRSIRVVSQKNEDGEMSAEYVGMVSLDRSAEEYFREITLSGVPQPPPSVTSRLHNQLNNSSPISTLVPKASGQIAAGNTFGVAICGNDFFANSSNTRGALWSDYWLNDGEAEADWHNTVYSSAMHYSADSEEWCLIKLARKRCIDRIVLVQRSRQSLTGFPVDFRVLASGDGNDWTTVADVTNFQSCSPNGRFVIRFEPREARYVKVVATRLREERGQFYFQLREIEIYGGEECNYALAANGGMAAGGNPLGGRNFDYRKFYSDIFQSGAKWVVVSNESCLHRYWNGKPGCTPAETENAEFLRKNGINLIYRFLCFPPFRQFRDNPEFAASEFAASVAPIVQTLRGKVAVWGLANEQNFYGDKLKPDEVAGYRNYYVKVVAAAADKIRELDPDVPIEIETALFDFGWTEAVLKSRLAGKIDLIGVHAYKELAARDTAPETAGADSRDGRRFYSESYRDYGEQIAAYRRLLDKIDPNLRINISETGVNTGVNPNGGAYYVSAKSQAKFLARLYLYNYMAGLGPTCWWSLDPVKTGEFIWGLVTREGERKDAWYVLRNIAAVIDNSCRLDSTVDFRIDGDTREFLSGVFRNEAGERLILYWSTVKMRDGNTGKAVDFVLGGVKLTHAEAIDTLSGTVHPIQFEQVGENYRLKNMIVRDYPVIIRIN